MKKNYSLLLFLVITSSLIAQSMSDFRKYFKEVHFNYLHVYSEWNENAAEYPKGSLYSFKGNKIDSSFYYLFQQQINNTSNTLYNVTSGDFYAGVYRFFISGSQEIFIVRGHDIDMREQPIYYLVFDRKQNRFTHSIELSDFFGYESAFGNRESWIVDLNEDGILDILTRSFIESTTIDQDEKVQIKEIDTLIAYVWEDQKIQSKIVDHLPFLKQKFLLRKVPGLEYKEQQQLTIALQKPSLKKERNEYFLVLGENKKLKDAIVRKQEIGELLESDYLYIGGKSVEIYFYDGFYFTVITGFSHKNKVDIALIEAKEKVHKEAYIQTESNWCTKRMEITCSNGYPCFYQCKE